MDLHTSRRALSRARFFLTWASSCSGEKREEYEACLEAAIIFARAGLHRLKSRYDGHPRWKAWWNGLRANQSVEFFRNERNWILKEGSPKVGQIVRLGGPSPELAQELYYYEEPGITATATVERHLDELTKLVSDAEFRFAE